MTDDLIFRLMGDLGGVYEDESQGAVHALVSMGKSVVTPLLNALKNENVAFCVGAAQVFAQIDAHEALPALVELLESDRDWGEQRIELVEAMVSLLKPQEGPNVPHLLDLLLDLSWEESSPLRVLSVRGLGRYGSKEVLPVLKRLSHDKDEAVAEEARAQLANFSDKPDKKIPSLDSAMLEAAARLSRKNGAVAFPDAESLQSKEATDQLLPLVNNASSGTLKAVTVWLKHIDKEDANSALHEIILNEANDLQRRDVALQSLIEVNQGQLEPVQALLEKLCKDPKAPMRRRALHTLQHLERPIWLEKSGDALFDEDQEVRDFAAELIQKNIQSQDKAALRPILKALQDFPAGEGRLSLLEALQILFDGSPGMHFILPEIRELLEAASAEEVPLLISMLEQIVPEKPHKALSQSLVHLLAEADRGRAERGRAERGPEQQEDKEDAQKQESVQGQGAEQLVLGERLVELLGRCLPRNASDATASLKHFLEQTASQETQEQILKLLGRITDQKSLELLISFAHGNRLEEDYGDRLRDVAQEVLEDLQGSLREVWREPDGTYHQRPGLPCECGGKLKWEPKGEEGDEELRCVECGREYVLSAPFMPVPIEKATAPLCSCCHRKQMLHKMGEGFYTCFQSGGSYTERFDTGELVRTSSLEHGLCRCCQPPQPMEQRGERVLCIQTGLSFDEQQQQEKASLPPIETGDFPAFSQLNGMNGTGRPTPSPPVRSFRLRRDLLAKHSDGEPSE